MSETLRNKDEVMATEQVLYSDQEMVTIANFPDPVTANIARSAIEVAGIPVFLQGENANSLLPVAFEARIQVRPQDEIAARKILDDFTARPEPLDEVDRAEQIDEFEASPQRGDREVL